MCALALALLLSAAEDPQAPSERPEPVREEERCEEAEVPAPSALEGARHDGQGRVSLRPTVQWSGDAAGFRLLDAADDLEREPELLRWVATDADLVRPRPNLVPGGGDSPGVRSDFGLRTELRLGALRMLAEGLARVDAKGTTDAANASLRLTPTGRVQLEAEAHERVHLGVEFCHRDARGIDARRGRTSGLASVRFGF